MSLNPLDWQAAWPVVFAGLWVVVFLRANATYWLGRAVLAGATHTRLRRVTASAGFQRAQDLVERWGAPVVSLSFLTVGFQTAANLSAGVTRMPLRHYLPAVVVGGAAWALIYSTLGLVGWSAVALAWRRWPAGVLIAGALALIALVWFVTRRMHAALPSERGAEAWTAESGISNDDVSHH